LSILLSTPRAIIPAKKTRGFVLQKRGGQQRFIKINDEKVLFRVTIKRSREETSFIRKGKI